MISPQEGDELTNPSFAVLPVDYDGTILCRVSAVVGTGNFRSERLSRIPFTGIRCIPISSNWLTSMRTAYFNESARADISGGRERGTTSIDSIRSSARWQVGTIRTASCGCSPRKKEGPFLGPVDPTAGSGPGSDPIEVTLV